MDKVHDINLDEIEWPDVNDVPDVDWREEALSIMKKGNVVFLLIVFFLLFLHLINATFFTLFAFVFVTFLLIGVRVYALFLSYKIINNGKKVVAFALEKKGSATLTKNTYAIYIPEYDKILNVILPKKYDKECIYSNVSAQRKSFGFIVYYSSIHPNSVWLVDSYLK